MLKPFSAVGLRGKAEGLPDYAASVKVATSFTVAEHDNTWLEKIVLRKSKLLYKGAGGC